MDLEMLAAMGATFGILMFIIAIAAIVGLWKVFDKAGKPGWAAIIPFYNFMVLLEVVGRPMWWLAVIIGLFLLSFIPLAGFVFSLGLIVVYAIVSIDLAKSFGKDTGYGIGILLLPFIFLPMLGFGNAQYQGPTQLPLPEQFT